MQLVLASPSITCDHCIATIQKTVDATEGASFVSGDPEARTFIVELERGAVLDTLGAALAEEGYPLGDLPSADAPSTHGTKSATWRPDGYRIERTEAGANVNYDCYCGCDAGFALDRAVADQAPESCCCGNQIFVGSDAEGHLRARLDESTAYRIDVQEATMPWGQPLQIAVAIPVDS